MTENDKKALRLIVASGGCLESYCSVVGELLYPEPKNMRSDGVDNRRRQGLALAGAKAMKRLEKQGLITIRAVCGSHLNQYRITSDGRKVGGQ